MNSLWVIQDFLSPSSFNGPSCNIEPFSSWFFTKRDEKKHLLFRSGSLPFWMVHALNRAFVALGVSRWELKVKRTRKKRKRSSQVPSWEPLTFYILFNNKIKFKGSIGLVNYSYIINFIKNNDKIFLFILLNWHKLIEILKFVGFIESEWSVNLITLKVEFKSIDLVWWALLICEFYLC